MQATIFAIGGLVGTAIGLPALAYIAGPAFKKKVENWTRLGAVAKIEVGTPTLFKTTVERQSGWNTEQDEISTYVLTEDGQDFIALSNICTHLGCRVRWVPDQGKFFCPCHNGVFDKQGNVLSGPPPRPLDRYKVKVENDVLSILIPGG
jgi:menaquinol-cytochrome c reductase iron-sulfur subunit